MHDVPEALALLQFGDSFFPSGANAFSWGLETLRADGRVAGPADVEALIAGQLAHRWAGFDRPALVWSYRCAGDLDAVAEIDHLVDAATLAREAREGGRRVGAALLRVHEGLGTSGCAGYAERVRAGLAWGQLPVVQGLLGEAVGLEEDTACAMSAYGLAVGLASAALRVGLVGHAEVQRILSRQRPGIAALIAAPVPPLGGVQSYTPMAEIAMMRHETGSGRLFAN